MKNIVFLFLFCFCVSVTAQNNEWVKVKDTASAYIIKFPLKPKKSSQNVPTAKGNIKMNSYALQSMYNDDNVMYMSSFSEYPKSFFETELNTFEARNKVLNGSVNGAVNNTNGILLSDKKIKFNGFDGRDIKIKKEIEKQDYIINMRCFLVEYKLYIVQVISTVTNEDNVSAKKFLNSFELIHVKH